MIHPLYARWRQRIGPVTMHVEPGRIVKRDGTVITTGLFNLPLGQRALPYALRICEPGEIIGLRGMHPGFNIGSVNPGHWDESHRAIRPGNEPLPLVVILPDDDVPDQPTIGSVTIEGANPSQGGAQFGGVVDFTLAGLRCWNEAVNKQNILVAQFIETGALRTRFCTFGSQDPSAWQGLGKMWGQRIHGLVSEVTCEYNTFSEALEHAVVYWDNAGYANSSSVHTVSDNIVTGRGGLRTCVQVTNRGISGRSGGGLVRIERNNFRSMGGGGGGCITIACHNGPVRIVENDVECDGDHSGVVVWTDWGKGIHYTPSGHSTGPVLIRKLKVLGGNRPHVAISGAERVRIEQSFRLEQGNGDGPRTCIDLDNNQGGPIDNGPVTFINCTEPMSSYSGFASGAKVKRQDSVLSNSQIDAMMVGQ